MFEPNEPLSDRELDVLQCVANGASNREIADELSISPNTVKVHLRNIYAKLGVSSRTEATTVAIQHGVIGVPGVETTVQSAATVEAEVESDVDNVAEPPSVETNETDNAASPTAADGLPSTLPAESVAVPRHATRPWRRLGLGALLVAVLTLAGLVSWQALSDNTVEEPTLEAQAPFEEQPLGETPWSLSRPMPAARKSMAMAAVGLNIYQIGGESANGVVNDVTVYETDRAQWRTAAPKLTAVADITAAVLAGEIYVPGGRQVNGQPTASVEVYSPANNAWRTIGDLPHPVAGGLALSDGSYVYLFGGWNGEDYLDTAYVYDPGSGRWLPLPSMGQRRAFAAGGVAAGQIYVFGGTDGATDLDVCERFDPVNNRWDPCPAMHAPRSAAGAVDLLNQIYVFGGGTPGQAAFAEKYNPNQESWEKIEMPALDEAEPRTHLGVANIETSIYVMGGEGAGKLLADNLIYRPLVYQFFIPAASTGNNGEP